MHESTAASNQATPAAPSAHRQEAEPRIFKDADKLRQTNSPDSRLHGQEDGSFSSLNPPYDSQAKENALSSGMGCFMKGTLVKRPEGWTPIDELKVGDLVMSRPENGIGEAVPKRVVNTFRYEDKEVWNLEFSTFPRRGGGGARLSATPDHPFCVYGVVTNLFMDSPFGVLGREDGIYYDNIDVENDKDWHKKFQALERFSQTPYEIALYEKPVWKRVDQLERGDMVLDALDKYRVVEMSRPYFAVDSDNPNHA